MSEVTPSQRRIPMWAWAFVVALPFLYVASVGPMTWAMVRAPSSGSPFLAYIVQTAMIIYTPPFFLAEHSEVVGDLLNMYVQVFDPYVFIGRHPPAIMPLPSSGS
jgi:hypothetical protein